MRSRAKSSSTPRRDARAQKDRLEEEPEVAARLRERRERTTSPSEPPWKQPAPRLELDEIQLNQLRALGYAVP